jgi:heptosyltransferase-2
MNTLPIEKKIPKRVILLRFGAVGDMILTTPALDALRQAWPTTHISYATRAELVSLIAHNPNIDEVIPLHKQDSIWQFAQRLRAQQPDLVIDLHHKSFCKVLRLLMPGIPFVVWHKRDLSETLRVRLLQQKPRSTLPTATRFHKAIEQSVGQTLPPGRLQSFLGPEDAENARRLLVAAGVDMTRPIIGFSPGANWQTKQWPIEYYSELAQRALQHGLQVVVQGNTAEKPLGRIIAENAIGSVDLCGQLDLPTLGGLLSWCSAFVTNDTGPMHMARGLTVPTLALFGSTDPAMFDFTGHALQWAGVECAPCSFFGKSHCPKGHFRCMRDISPASAWAALQNLMAAKRPGCVSA